MNATPSRNKDATNLGAMKGTSRGESAASGRLVGITMPPDDHPIYNLIGRVTGEWAHLEHDLDRIIWRLSGTDTRSAACITAQLMGHGPRFLSIIALLTKLGVSAKTIKLADILCGKTSELSTERNRAVHDAWFIEVGTNSLSQQKSMAKKELKFGDYVRDTKEIKDLIPKIRGIREKVAHLDEAIRAERAP